MIISFIFDTIMFDLGVMMKGEIRSWSLLEVKRLSYQYETVDWQ